MLETCDPAVPGVADAATVADFVLAFTTIEAVELSNLDSGGSSVDCDRINKALLDAYKLLVSYKGILVPAAAKVIDINLNRWMLILARYYLDTLRRRDDVSTDYKSVMDMLGKLSSSDVASASQFIGKVYNSNGKSPVFTEQSLARVNRRSTNLV